MMSDNPFGPWGVALSDQVQAAIDNDDWPVVAALLVDGFLVASEEEHGGQPLPLEYFVGAIQQLSIENMALWCGEALRRLYEQKRNT